MYIRERTASRLSLLEFIFASPSDAQTVKDSAPEVRETVSGLIEPTMMVFIGLVSQ